MDHRDNAAAAAIAEVVRYGVRPVEGKAEDLRQHIRDQYFDLVVAAAELCVASYNATGLPLAQHSGLGCRDREEVAVGWAAVQEPFHLEQSYDPRFDCRITTLNGYSDVIAARGVVAAAVAVAAVAAVAVVAEDDEHDAAVVAAAAVVVVAAAVVVVEVHGD
jgi:hypothetical protein